MSVEFTHPTFTAAMALLGLTEDKPRESAHDRHRFNYGRCGLISCKHDSRDGRIAVHGSVPFDLNEHLDSALRYTEEGAQDPKPPKTSISTADTVTADKLATEIKRRLLPDLDRIISRVMKRKESADDYKGRLKANTAAAAKALGLPVPTRTDHYAHHVARYWDEGGGRIQIEAYSDSLKIEANLPTDLACEVLAFLRARKEAAAGSDENDTLEQDRFDGRA